MRAIHKTISLAAVLMLGASALPAMAQEASSITAVGAVAAPPVQSDPRVQVVDHGIVVTPDQGAARRLRLQVYGPETIRVTAVPGTSFDALPASVMVTAQPTTDYSVSQANGLAVLDAGGIKAEVDLATGRVRFLKPDGTEILAERTGRVLSPTTVEDQNGHHDFLATAQVFDAPEDESFYGLGQHQQGVMDQRGADVELAQHNIDVGVPFVVSSGGWGVLWDNNSITRFGDPRPYGMIDERLIVRDQTGRFGGLTTSYFQNDELRVQRQEAQINYEYIRDQQRWPEGFKAQPNQPVQVGDMGRSGQEGVRVVWEGTIETPTAGEHRFRLYSSNYAKVWINGELQIDRWRQNWNPWFHDFQVELPADEQVSIKVEWIPGDGYIALRHLDPRPAEDREALSIASEVGSSIDYYVVGGGDMDGALANYRRLTGRSVMLPRWAYGFWQSRQRYNTQAEVLGVAAEYRRLELPIDNIVQDWFYWPENAWGSHEFEASRFPDPGEMVSTLHSQNINIILSVWPKFYPTTEHYQELAAIGGMYTRNVEAGAKDWVGPGYENSFYDPYLPAARDLYWRQMWEHLGEYDFDGWWLDSVEPDMHSNLDLPERALRAGPTALGPGVEYFNSYPLVNAEGVYQHFRATQPDTRTYILTRSAWGGLQRTGSTLWSGDVVARWDDLREQVSAGVNTGFSGIANWTHDIGGFAVEARYSNPAGMTPENKAEWQELNLRWFQFGAWSPIFRSHGEFPLREVYNLAEPGTDLYDAFAEQMRRRYRLMPYIYTLAGDAYHKDDVIMRGLALDFPGDERARTVNDQYLLGPAFLVAPVHEYRATSRKVWLPQGANWVDFYTGRTLTGGQEITAQAPLDRIPLYVRAGSIVPTGPAVQHTAEALDGPITLNVYLGADGSFELYDDAGTTYGYERGEFSRTPISWNQRTGVLSIGARQGEYPGMAATRTIHVRFIDQRDGAEAANFDARPDRTVEYSGTEVLVRR